MNRLALLTAPILVLAACGSDYGVTAEKDRHGVDSGEAPELDTAPPEEDLVDPDAPIAVCDVYPNPVTPPFEPATWDGSGSYDPNGLALNGYFWELVDQPPGAAMTIGGAGAVRSGFTPEIAGDYTAQLVVRNEAGVDSEPCEITLQAIPAEDLWIEMYWSKARDDMDLHLLAPGATMADLRSSQDCYYANCVGSGLNWGDSGPADNPVLDLDDIPGTGPENINIESPEDGTYRVVVHDHTSNTLHEANAVTVNIYLDGSLVWSDTRNISGEDDYVEFANIDYATRTVTGI